MNNHSGSLTWRLAAHQRIGLQSAKILLTNGKKRRKPLFVETQELFIIA